MNSNRAVLKIVKSLVVILFWFQNLYGQAPAITGFTPTNGPIGTVVNIVGTNFSTTSSDNIVFFGATQATVTLATTTQLTVTLPTGATYAPITVLNTGTGLLAYSMSNFTPTFSPNKGSITVADFEPNVDFTSSANPLSISIGDLDGDGKADLAVANTASNTVSVFRNTSTGAGDISYATKVDYPTANAPQVVAIGDLDGDGKADLAVATFSGNSVSVFRNTSAGVGSISYAAKVDFTTGTATRAISVGDLDNDGKVDLAVANDGGSSVSVFKNTSTGVGNINYAARVDYPTGGAGSSPRSVSIGDLDGDGKADLAVANSGSNSVSVFMNTSAGPGSISYAAKVDYTTGTSPNSVVMGDIDGDGKADLTVVNRNDNSISVFRNISAGVGSIDYAPKVDYTTGLDPRSVSMGDLDGDGKPDLVLANNTDNSVTAFRNTSTVGNITYALSVDYTTGGVGSNPRSISIGDLDGDGMADIAVANTSSDLVSVIRNNPVFTTHTITGFTPISGTVGTTVTITGTNFSTTPGDNDVQFNGTSASVTSSSATSITCMVPIGASTGPITITLAGETATSPGNFTLIGSLITITTQPTSVTACDGQTVTFTTAATGTTNITYQWQMEDSDGDMIDVIDGGGYSGATTPVLAINTSGNFGEGNYQCIISGDFTSDVDSDDVFLDITPNAPNIADAVNCGPGAVTVTASGGTNGQYRWYTQATGGTAISGEVNGLFTTPFLTSTTLYYVAINNGVCEGPRSDVQVAISTCEPQPGFVWGQGMGVGTMANGTNGGGTILIDSDGNLLVAGNFQGTIDFDNGPGTVNLTASSTDAFLLKMTPSGTLLWVKGIGGPGSGNDSAGDMSIDATGNIYMLFAFAGTADFDPSAAVASLTSTPSSPANKLDLAVAKYDRDGNFIWVRRIGGDNDERTGGLKADAAGNVYITGQFRGTTNFNGSFPRTALGANSTDVLFAKMDTNGTFLWAGSIGSPLATAANLFSDGGTAVDIDGAGNAYVSGRVYGPNTTVDFDPGTGTAPQAIIDDRAGFVLKLDNSGIYQNHYVVEGAAGNEVSIDASGNIYFTGAFTGTVDIDPGPGVFSVTGNGANYITKLNSSGNFVWGKVLNPGGFGVSPTVLIGGIDFDAAGNLHVTGYNTAGATDFDLGPLAEPRGLNGLFVLNPFVWKLNSDGDFKWVINMRRISGGFATASIASVAVSTTGDIFTTGNYARNVDLDPGLCEFGVTNLNGQDIFISRLSPAQPNVCFAQQPMNVSACDNDITTFTAGVAEAGSIFYQWQKLNTTTSQFENISNTGGYSGTTTATLTVNTAGNFGVGAYRCKVSGNTTVSEFSNSATLSFVSTAALLTTGAAGCQGSTVILTASGGNDGEYRWYTSSTGGIALSGEVNSTYTTPVLNSTTTYYVSINNGTCEGARTPVIATINASPSKPTITSSITPSANTVSVCSSNILTLAAPTGFSTYAWSPSGNTQQIVPSTSGTYSVTVTDASGCSSVASDALTVTVIPAPCNNQAPVIASTSAETQIEGKVSLDLVSLISDADGNVDIQSLKIKTQPTSGAKASITASGRLELDYQGISFSGPDVLTIEVCDLLGDCAQQEIKIEVIGDLNIYNGISPNGDGMNDTWIILYIETIEETKNNKVSVYNRWGDLVWETENYDNKDRAFKGLNKNGNEVSSGTYFYKIEFGSGRKTETGYLSVKK